MTEGLIFNDAVLRQLKDFKFKIDWKDHTNPEDESKIIITIPEINPDEVEEWVNSIVEAGQ